MGLDELHLRVLATSSEDRKQKQNAQRGGNSFKARVASILKHLTSPQAIGQGKALGPSRQFFFLCLTVRILKRYLARSSS